VRQTTSIGPQLTRRRFLGLGLAAITAAPGACTSKPKERNELMTPSGQQPLDKQPAETGRLLARPAQPVEMVSPGLQALGLGTERDGLLYIPPGYQPDRPAPLVLMLHGAGGIAQHGLTPLQPLADEIGMILLAPDSRGRTWDIIIGRYGPDIAFIEQALAQTFNRCAVDPAHLAVGGFSDGASYALSIGLINGDLFSHVIAFSPGFMSAKEQNGSPRIFISHGTQDPVLPIDRCSRRIVPQLQQAGYDVHYREFHGPHTVPPEIAQEAVDWFK
jgi:phospholipase/carboxylesterase